MGLFDIEIKKQLDGVTNQKNILEELDSLLSPYTKSSTHESSLSFTKFRPKNSLLSYSIEGNLSKKELYLKAEITQLEVLILVALILLSILFTMGLAIIPIIGYAVYQKFSTQKFLDKLLESLKT